MSAPEKSVSELEKLVQKLDHWARSCEAVSIFAQDCLGSHESHKLKGYGIGLKVAARELWVSRNEIQNPTLPEEPS